MGSRLSIDNCRPISLLSDINKIFEKLKCTNVYITFCLLIMSFSNYSSVLGKNTLDNSLSLDNNKYTCGIFIDLKKAFDTVDHKILPKKLNHYGIV